MKLTSLNNDMTYNGWENFETWNVSLWIQNDEALYLIAKSFAADGKDYLDFCDYLIQDLGCTRTPDGVKFDNPLLDVLRLNEMMEELWFFQKSQPQANNTNFKQMPDFDLILSYENGTLDYDGVLQLFQQVYDTQSYTWLQGHYGRTLKEFIENGLIATD